MIPSENNNGSFALVNPIFPGGLTALTAFVENAKPQLFIKDHPAKEPAVFVEFVVNTDGSISDFVVLKGLSTEADLEAVRVVSTMPNWTPGTINGEPVRAKFVLPIKFRSDTPAS